MRERDPGEEFGGDEEWFSMGLVGGSEGINGKRGRFRGNSQIWALGTY